MPSSENIQDLPEKRRKMNQHSRSQISWFSKTRCFCGAKWLYRYLSKQIHYLQQTRINELLLLVEGTKNLMNEGHSKTNVKVFVQTQNFSIEKTLGQ